MKASWSAVAKRSDDTAFERTASFQIRQLAWAAKSGVALRFPPQSMTRSVSR